MLYFFCYISYHHITFSSELIINLYYDTKTYIMISTPGDQDIKCLAIKPLTAFMRQKYHHISIPWCHSWYLRPELYWPDKLSGQIHTSRKRCAIVSDYIWCGFSPETTYKMYVMAVMAVSLTDSCLLKTGGFLKEKKYNAKHMVWIRKQNCKLFF